MTTTQPRPMQGAAPFPTRGCLVEIHGTHYTPLMPAACLPVWDALAHVDLDPALLPGSDEDTEAELRVRKARVHKAAGFAAAQRKNVEKLLQHRHGSPQCDTDDGVVWLEDVISFVVEEAEIRGHSAIVAGLKWGRKFCPLVSLDEVAEIIFASLASRDEATRRYTETGRRMQWLPVGEDRKLALLTKWDEVTGLGLRGMASIDPLSTEDMRDRKTGQREKQRRDRGVKPMETRTLMKDRKRLADCFGVDVRTVQRWEGKGAIPAERVQNLSPPCRQVLRGDTNWTSLLPAKDDELLVSTAAVIETVPVENVPANDDTPPPALLTETGYIGQNMEMTADEVRSIVERHPALQEDLQRHLAAVDDGLARTPPEYRLKVRRNLFRDRNLLAHRERRARERAEAVVVPIPAFTGRNVSLSADEMTELAKRYPILAPRMHDHLSELEGTLSRMPQSIRKQAMHRVLGARTNRLRSRQRFDQLAA